MKKFHFLTIASLFICFSVNAQILATGEYFIDADSGLGTGISITVPPDSSINNVQFDIPSLALSPGYHYVYFRLKDSNGQWGMTRRQRFYVFDNSPIVNIVDSNYLVAAEYFIDSLPVHGQGTIIPLPHVDTINYQGSLPLFSLDSLCHTVSIWVEDKHGVWSFAKSNTLGTISDFQYVVSDGDVQFQNLSAGNSTYAWDFGDGNFSILENPFHHYIDGTYNACLTTSNQCIIQSTFCKTIDILGLATINTNHGGNGGAVSVNVTGGAFADSMQLYLHRDSLPDIYGDTVIVNSSTLMTTDFDLTGQPLGLWDVVAIYPSGDTATLSQAFTIEPTVSPDSSMWVSITGDYVLREGFNQVYTVTCGNSGNIDAVFVPLIITGLPIGTEIEIKNPILNLDTLFGLDTFSIDYYSIPHTIQDTIRNDAFRIFFIGKIAAGSTITLTFIFHLPINPGLLHTETIIKAILGRPLYRSEDGLRDANASLFNCTASIFKNVTEIAVDLSGAGDWYECALGMANQFAGAYDWGLKYLLGNQDVTLPYATKGVIDGLFLYKDAAESVIKCTEAVTGTVIPISRGLRIAQNVADWTQRAYDAYTNSDYISDCFNVYKNAASSVWQALVGNATDPNEKYGPGGGSVGHYLSLDNPLAYTINFTNDSASVLSAQTVTVIDSLNANYFDLNSFGFTSVTIGDSSFSLSYAPTSFIHTFDFSATMGVKARVVGNYDVNTGIATWTCYSIDPATDQITTNALAGFLPPDSLSPLGQGYLTFIVKPNAALQTGSVICNRASIIFDANPPIVTPCWQNQFDLVDPSSFIQSFSFDSTTSQTFNLKIHGADNYSGVRYYDIYYSKDQGPFIPWAGQLSLSDTVVSFTGDNGHYDFYSVATDSAGNVEDAPLIPDASTYIYTGINNVLNGAASVVLYQNAPNPFNSATVISYYLPSTQDAEIIISDVLGKKVSQYTFKSQQPGKHSIKVSNSSLAMGQYFYQLRAEHATITKRMVVTGN